MKLSLMDNELTSMMSKLNSYRCEPCTSAMYEQYLELNHDGKILKQGIDKLKELVQDSVKLSKSIGEEINKIMRTYYVFQNSLSSYLSEAAIHH
ncbi:hypothetical protein GCM10022258_34620 [Aquimarina gracilis]